MDIFFKQEKQQIDEILSKKFSDLDEFEHIVASKYSLLPEGKRYRGIIARAIYRAFGFDVLESDDAVSGIEMLHQASLIFDDLPAIDDAPIRKGKPTIHKKYKESTAIFAGLYLQEVGRKILNDSFLKKNSTIMLEADALISESVLNLLKGQELDLVLEKSEQDLIRAMLLKNSTLYLSFTLPITLLGQTKYKDDFKMVAENICIAYQFLDDLRDLQNIETIGKPTGVDFKKHTSVYRFGKKYVEDEIIRRVSLVRQILVNIPNTNELRFIINYIFNQNK